MHTKSKIITLTLLIVSSLVSFCYINFYSGQVIDTTNIIEIISTQDTDFNTLLPEFELLERLLQKILPVIQ